MLLAVLLTLTAPRAAPRQFNNTKCPGWWEMQSERMAHFQLEQLGGFYYELSLHDVTQYPLCPAKPRCISSNKSLVVREDGSRYVNDSWNLFCFNGYYPQVLLFNETETPGYLRGYVPTTRIPFLPPGVASHVVFPDTIVDFRPGADGWALEFQCVELLGKVVFTGVNFYSKQKTETAYQEMLDAAVASGIDFYFKEGLGLTNVSHDNCPLPPRYALPTSFGGSVKIDLSLTPAQS